MNRDAMHGAGVCFLALAALSVAIAALSGCGATGYRMGPVHSTDIRTVSTPIFENQTFEPGPERLLTEAVAKAITSQTPWGVTNGLGSDATITGRITDIEYDRLGRIRGTGLADESIVRIRVDFDFTDNRTGRTLVSRRGFEVLSAFVPNIAVGESAEVGRFGAYDELAGAIVRELRGAW